MCHRVPLVASLGAVFPITLGALLAILLLSLLRLHGFSLAAWRAEVDGSAPVEVLAGRAQAVRSDDYAAVLPQILSQRAHEPAFPRINRLIGAGACNMAVNYPMPIRDWTLLFRPTVWGYFLNADFGLAWHWWTQTIGAWLLLFMVLSRIAPGRIGLAAAGAAALVVSPFFQYWSQNAGPSVAYPLAALLCALGLDRTRSRTAAGVFAAGLTACLLAWWLTFSFFPYLVTMAWLTVFLYLGLRQPSPPDTHPPSTRARMLLILAAVAGAALLALLFIWQNQEAIRTALRSVYPGRRLAEGGEANLAELFRGWFLAWIYPDKRLGLEHLKRATCFCLFTPLSLALLGWRWFRTGQRPNRLQVALMAALLLFAVWYAAGLPAWLARPTGLTRVPPPRALLAIGLTDMFLLAAVLKEHAGQPSRQPFGWFAWAGWAGLLLAEGLALHAILPARTAGELVLAGSITWILGGLLIFRPRAFLPALALSGILTTFPFNPLARGGADFIRHNPLSAAILEASEHARDRGITPVWIAYGRDRYDIVLPNLFRMLGLPSPGGVHPYPQPALWAILDPERAFESVWNRYAHVRFVLPDSPGAMEIRLLQPDLLVVALHPEHPRFQALGITHVLVQDRPDAWDAIPGLRRLASVAGKHLYEVRSRQPADNPTGRQAADDSRVAENPD
jgi:hypothetical protein